jgi:hypothetical protein
MICSITETKSIKTLPISNADKDAEQQELLFIVSWTTKWYD